MNLDDKRVLLIGAGGGIGQAVARKLDQKGAHLILVGRNKERLEKLSQGLANSHTLLAADFTTEQGRTEILRECDSQGIHLIINAAGAMDFELFEQQKSAAIETMMCANLIAPIQLCRTLIPVLQQREEAAIVNIGSIFGSIGHPGFSVYCATKFGLRGFTESLQRELADGNIKVLYLAPRATRTNLNTAAIVELNKALGNATDSPDKVADELVHLISREQKQCYMGWPEKLFVMVNSLFPSIVHKALVNKLPIVHKFTRLQA